MVGVMAAALSALFWQLIKAKDDYAKTCLDDKQICMTALAGLNTATAALTNEMKNENKNIAQRQEEILTRLNDINDTLRAPPPDTRTRR